VAYSGVYVFGDSLVDSGNALKLAQWYGSLPFTALPDGTPTAELGYFKGRFSDGYTYTDLISNKAIGLVTKPVFPFGFVDPWLGAPLNPFAGDPSGNNLNFAYGGAHVIKGDEAVSDFDDQTDAFKDAVDHDADPNALYLVTFGGNDVRDLAPTGSDPVPVAEAHAQLQDVAEEMIEEIGQIINVGARNIVITGMADVGLIPRYDRDGNGVLDAIEQMRSDAATAYSAYLDTLIREQVVPALEAEGANVTYVPLMDYSDGGVPIEGALNANLPTLAYLHGLDSDELFDNLLAHKEVVFFDHVHPNAQAHALLASYMQAEIANVPLVETMPLLGADVDYKVTATIGSTGEIDRATIAMVAGTSYTFQLLGISSITPYVLGQLGIASLPAGAILADPKLRLVNSVGSQAGADDDSGAGLDSTLTFTPGAAGNYTLEMSAVGALTGSYVMTATVTGAAMQAGNSYSVSNASTLVLEGAGGVGQDVVRTSVTYALAAGSEVEVLRTSNDRGTGAINLTGNEFGQSIVGNRGANILEGKAGADMLTGGAGNDRFILSGAALTGPGHVDGITDYARGDIVDVSQILSLSTGTNPVAGGYLRVTIDGRVQVDMNGGGDGWTTLSTVNGSGAVTLRYLSGGAATDVSITRVGTSALSAEVELLGRQHQDDIWL
jgi:phospholipase/lecithinase/hemolysin